MHSRLTGLLLLGLLFAFAGCAHISDLQSAHTRGQGMSVSYAVSADEAWKISLEPDGAQGFVLKEGEKLRRERIVIGPHS